MIFHIALEQGNPCFGRFPEKAHTLDELIRRRLNATLGVEDGIDPGTGRQIKLESSSDYDRIDQRGTIVGTQTDTRPNLDFRDLVRLP